jgi:hypothetical protein
MIINAVAYVEMISIIEEWQIPQAQASYYGTSTSTVYYYSSSSRERVLHNNYFIFFIIFTICVYVRPKTDPGAGSDFVVSVFYGSDPMMPNTETLIKSPQVGVMITRFLWVGLRYADDRTPCHKL